MSDVNLSVAAVNRTSGANYTTGKVVATSANNYYFANDGNTRLVMAASTTATVTVTTPNSIDGNAIGDLAIVLTTDVETFGPFPVSVYGSNVKVTVSADTSILAMRG